MGRGSVVAVGVLLFAVVLGMGIGHATGVGGEPVAAADGSGTAVATTIAPGGPETSQDIAQAVEIEVSRNQTVLNSPVTLRTVGEDGDANWTLAGPSGSDATLQTGRGDVVRFQPDVAGTYEVTVATPRGTATRTVTAQERTAVIEEFAPRLHFHEDAPYRPTRIETIVENAVLRQAGGETVTESPTVFDLANRDGSHYLDLEGSESEYPTYQEAFPPTVYANYVENVSYEGDTYDAVHYWFVYTYDPKHGFSSFGAHQGDVEWTSVLVDGDGEPAYVLPGSHGGQTVAPYDQYTSNGRLDLYPEHRSHATYLSDASRYEGDGFQVYEFWSDGSAACGDLAYFESVFHNEWTGSADTLTPRDGSGANYELVELTGDEVWATYEGGLNSAPGSITIPHDRGVFDDPEQRFASACPAREQVSGSLSVDGLDQDTGTVDATVENDGGKPHEFWVTLENETAVLDSESVRVGTSRWELVDETGSVTLTFDAAVDDSQAFETAENLSVELWLHPPDTRRTGDREEVVRIVDGEIRDSDDGIPLWLRIWAGVGIVTLGSFAHRRRIAMNE